MMNFYHCITQFVLKSINNLNDSNLKLEKVYQGNRSTVYNINSKYCLKEVPSTYKIDFMAEIKALKAFQNFTFAPRLFAIDEQEQYILMEWLEGYDIIDFCKKYDELPNTFLQDYYETRIKMLELGFEDRDFKLDSLIWKDKNTLAKKFDYGLCDYIGINSSTNVIERLLGEYTDLKNGDINAWSKLRKMLYLEGVRQAHVDKLERKFVEI